MGTLATRLKKGDRRPSFTAALFDPDGTPTNLTGVTVAFRMRNAVTKVTVINDAPAIVASAVEGKVRYDWTAPDTATPGEFEAWVIVDYGSSVVESFPNRDHHSVRIEP